MVAFDGVRSVEGAVGPDAEVSGTDWRDDSERRKPQEKNAVAVFALR